MQYDKTNDYVVAENSTNNVQKCLKTCILQTYYNNKNKSKTNTNLRKLKKVEENCRQVEDEMFGFV